MFQLMSNRFCILLGLAFGLIYSIISIVLLGQAALFANRPAGWLSSLLLPTAPLVMIPIANTLILICGNLLVFRYVSHKVLFLMDVAVCILLASPYLTRVIFT